MFRAIILAGAALTSLLGMVPVSAAVADPADRSWSLGCPPNGLASAARVDGRPDAVFTRVYRSATGEDGTICVVEVNGRALRMVRQVLREGSSLSDVMHGPLAAMFPARPGRQISVTALLPADGAASPEQQEFTNSFRYVGQQLLKVGGRQRWVALLVHREEGRASSYASESHYYFDVVSHELLRFDYRQERGVRRPILSWHVMGARE